MRGCRFLSISVQTTRNPTLVAFGHFYIPNSNRPSTEESEEEYRLVRKAMPPKPHSMLPGHAVPGHHRPDPPPPGTPGHDEWLIDISIEHTFPASDPPSTMDPGSIAQKEERKNKR
jgi:hypothetical protein